MFSSTKWQKAEEKWRRLKWRNRKKEGKNGKKQEARKAGKWKKSKEKREKNVKRESTSIRYQFLTSTANNITQSIEQQPSTNFY